MKSIIPKVIIGLVILIIILYGITTLRNRSSTTLPTFLPTPTPVPLSFKPKNYSDSDQHYSIQYPQEWTQQNTDITQVNNAGFKFSEGGHTYTFNIIAPLGNTVPELALTGADKVDTTTVNYGGHRFLKRTYTIQGTPILLFASPDEPNLSFYSFMIQLPPTNTQKYIQIFDEILTNMQVNKNFDPNSVLNPHGIVNPNSSNNSNQ